MWVLVRVTVGRVGFRVRARVKVSISHMIHKKGKGSPYSITERRVPDDPGSCQSASR